MSATENKNVKGNNLILVGFMGTGKTTVGKKVARSLGFRFVDTDELIVEAAGKSILDIFADSGEDAFRELETEILKKCALAGSQVISTGGGIILREENRKILKNAGYVIWLQASPEAIIDRVSRNQDRPLLAEKNPAKTVNKLLIDRHSFYKEVTDLTIVTDDLLIEETVYGVAESARLALG